ncbi:hypothetical protein EYF80_047612 [Liparis tanakae]|uniref:Uncharacterized protein n=1 Tax=Liparis tanakae TaxID=230148 RepID=A0A4Z2FLT2_9TELE|nr:hypothetical protein EYF80_047612 [Liparis tanakae]
MRDNQDTLSPDESWGIPFYRFKHSRPKNQTHIEDDVVVHCWGRGAQFPLHFALALFVIVVVMVVF